MKKKILVPVIVILLLVVCSVVYYFTPKTFSKNVNPNEVDHINIFDGNTGTGFTISDPEDIKYVVENIQSYSMKRDGISIGHMGYLFSISYIDSNDKEIIPLFYMNSENTIRKDPFFYTCEGGLCVDYIKGLEPDTSIEVSALDDSIAICIDGITYYGLGEAVPVEPDESAIEYVQIPAGSDGATITAFAKLEEGRMIVCLVDGEWYKFHSMEALASSEVHLENKVACECAEDELPRLIMVNDELYYDCAEESTVDGRCGMMDGVIDSSTQGENGIPRKNNWSNFGTGYGYQYGPQEGTIEVCIDDQWWVFRKYERGLIGVLDDALEKSND